MKVLFIGDIVGPPGVQFLERQLKSIISEYAPDVVVANGENASTTGLASPSGFGISKRDLERIFAAGVEVVTTGNHAWDGPDYEAVLSHPQVLRPINHGKHGPGKGAVMWETKKGRLGIINVAGRTAIPNVDDYSEAVETQVELWGEEVDAVIVDMHAENLEMQILAARLDGKVSAVFGTHTHVPTLDAQILPGGTAYVSDVGMVGPTGGVSGVDPEYFREWSKRRVRPPRQYTLAAGPMTCGAMIAELDGFKGKRIYRVCQSYVYEPKKQVMETAAS